MRIYILFNFGPLNQGMDYNGVVYFLTGSISLCIACLFCKVCFIRRSIEIQREQREQNNFLYEPMVPSAPFIYVTVPEEDEPTQTSTP